MAVAAGPALRPLSPLPSELTGRARQPWEASAPCVPPPYGAGFGVLKPCCGWVLGSFPGQRSAKDKTKQNAELLRGKKKNRKRKKQLAAFALVLNYHNPS